MLDHHDVYRSSRDDPTRNATRKTSDPPCDSSIYRADGEYDINKVPRTRQSWRDVGSTTEAQSNKTHLLPWGPNIASQEIESCQQPSSLQYSQHHNSVTRYPSYRGGRRVHCLQYFNGVAFQRGGLRDLCLEFSEWQLSQQFVLASQAS